MANSSTPIFSHDEQSQSTMYDAIFISYSGNGHEQCIDTEAPTDLLPTNDNEAPTVWPPVNDTMSVIDVMELSDGHRNSSDGNV